MSFESLLNTTCDIQEKTETQDAQTGEMVASWANVFTDLDCRIVDKNFVDSKTSSSLYQKSTHMLYMEYKDIMPTTHRFVIDSENYKIYGISDMGSSAKYLCIYLAKYE
ncbi:MAG: head-tail adaptor protein [Elusimicrobiaceae bacterium]|jgi:hypothetical protein|nr:head-tail adaptor protein [Elusimicrobiaceae bacterium]MBT3955136.1 head-tail adaptor protein [Elusimicrobiaceae bacterium]MBT4007971.1 head-tail adaptor protein [Elusimicrobiaceae bacterium]MBT4402648.1 head-tail adaptor protein [Elusimicrobiaceae bacterium]MBT4440321.1 head-tail adaptor protein [Elusimicrobiaceae bacterium]